MKNILLITLSILLFTSCEKNNDQIPEIVEADPSEVRDIDGNIYHTIRLAGHLWLVENLRTTKFQNGDLINYLDQSNSNVSSYASYKHDENLSKTYGYLYNLKAVEDERKICPKGWHIPSTQVWNGLISHFGQAQAAMKLKEQGSAHWVHENVGSTNESGFTALPGGYFDFTFKRFSEMGIYGYWWPSNGNGNSKFYISSTNLHHNIGFSSMSNEGHLYSIRCIKD